MHAYLKIFVLMDSRCVSLIIDKRKLEGAMDDSSAEQQIHKFNVIVHIV